MLSENHHAAYWLFAIAARILYEVLSACGWRHTVVGSLLLLGAIERLMFHWNPPIPTRHKILLLREWGDLPYYEIMGCCLVGLGVLVDLTANHEDGVSSAAMLGQSRAIHILVAFSVLGIVEPIRQNRTDVESCFLLPPRIVSAYPNPARLRAYCYLFGMVGFTMALMLLDVILHLPIFGGLSVTSLHRRIASLGIANQSIILPCLYSPLADTIETLFYIMQRRGHSTLIPERTQLIRDGERWSWKRIAIVRVWLRCLGFLSIGAARGIPEVCRGILILLATEYLFFDESSHS